MVGIHLARQIRIRGDLPAAQINRLEARFYGLHCLISGQRSERRHRLFLVQKRPQPLRTHPRERVFDDHAATQPLDVRGAIAALHSVPTGF